jgi:hypothetical protein
MMSLKSRLFFNINAGACNRELVENWVVRAQPACLFVMDGYDWLLRLHTLSPHSRLIHRTYVQEEGVYHITNKPEDVAERLLAEYGPSDIVYHTLLNEPDELTAREWFIKLIEYGVPRGLRFAVGEFAASKSFYYEDFQSGFWDEFLATIHKYRDSVVLTVHEYTMGSLGAYFMEDTKRFGIGDPNNLMYSEAYLPEYFCKNTPRIDGRRYWHLRRTDLLIKRMRDMGMDPPEIHITEAGFDRMPDMQGTAPWAEWERQGLHVWGVSSIPRLLDIMLSPQRDKLNVLLRQILWLDQVLYPPEYTSINLFAINENWSDKTHHYPDVNIGGLVEDIVTWGSKEKPVGTVGGVVDLAQYLVKPGPAYKLLYFGQHEEICQLQRHGDAMYQVKNGNWEQLWVAPYEGEDWIWRGRDVSPNEQQYYDVGSSGGGHVFYGAPWVKRFASEGEKFTTDKIVAFHNKVTNENDSVYETVDRIQFITWLESIELSGVVVDDVVILGWENYERYVYARGIGLVGWTNQFEEEFWVSRIVSFRETPPIPKYTHLMVNPVDPKPDFSYLGEETMSYDRTCVKARSTEAGTNIREQPTVKSPVIDMLMGWRYVRVTSNVAQAEKLSWDKIEWDGRVGYVASKYTQYVPLEDMFCEEESDPNNLLRLAEQLMQEAEQTWAVVDEGFLTMQDTLNKLISAIKNM